MPSYADSCALSVSSLFSAFGKADSGEGFTIGMSRGRLHPVSWFQHDMTH